MKALNGLGYLIDAGLPLNRLYTVCREQFLVSSEVTLRAHLTEFKDHELLKFRRGSDGLPLYSTAYRSPYKAPAIYCKLAGCRIYKAKLVSKVNGLKWRVN